MNRRTRNRPAAPGMIREWRYNEFRRQGLGLLMMFVYSVLARPEPVAF